MKWQERSFYQLIYMPRKLLIFLQSWLRDMTISLYNINQHLMHVELAVTLPYDYIRYNIVYYYTVTALWALVTSHLTITEYDI